MHYLVRASRWLPCSLPLPFYCQIFLPCDAQLWLHMAPWRSGMQRSN